MVDELKLVSLTMRMAQAELLATQLRDYLSTLPVHELEEPCYLVQFDALLLTLRAEITDWQRLACSVAACVHPLTGPDRGLSSQDAIRAGLTVGAVVARSVETIEARKFTDSEVLELGERWPRLVITKSTNGHGPAS